MLSKPPWTPKDRHTFKQTGSRTSPSHVPPVCPFSTNCVSTQQACPRSTQARIFFEKIKKKNKKKRIPNIPNRTIFFPLLVIRLVQVFLRNTLQSATPPINCLPAFAQLSKQTAFLSGSGACASRGSADPHSVVCVQAACVSLSPAPGPESLLSLFVSTPVRAGHRFFSAAAEHSSSFLGRTLRCILRPGRRSAFCNALEQASPPEFK